jgi:hypothetical protein
MSEKDYNMIKFKAKYSPTIELRHLDEIDFQWSGIDEEGEYIMYNNCAECLEEDGKMFVCWNGNRYPAHEFLYCDHLNGDINMDYVRVVKLQAN